MRPLCITRCNPYPASSATSTDATTVSNPSPSSVPKEVQLKRHLPRFDLANGTATVASRGYCFSSGPHLKLPNSIWLAPGGRRSCRQKDGRVGQRNPHTHCPRIPRG